MQMGKKHDFGHGGVEMKLMGEGGLFKTHHDLESPVSEETRAPVE